MLNIRSQEALETGMERTNTEKNKTRNKRAHLTSRGGTFLQSGVCLCHAEAHAACVTETTPPNRQRRRRDGETNRFIHAAAMVLCVIAKHAKRASSDVRAKDVYNF
ncbi:hypothetical protein EVAR_67001_1 [Eumeta japonica]|uniref:Uncharacterized protein n=1 Tax=Eumeta variegata TaxID=151549 RepID=A0A4C1ZRR8_EUMVA|nr:hypothetical protein EVAR_67001_1 [Eumeta japonica]